MSLSVDPAASAQNAAETIMSSAEAPVSSCCAAAEQAFMVSELFLDAEANLAFAEFDLAETALEDQAEVVTELLLNAEDSVPQKIRRLGSNNPNVQQLAGDVENDLTKLMLQAEVALDAAEAALSAEVEQAKDAIGSAQELLSAEATEFEKQECSGEDTETESA